MSNLLHGANLSNLSTPILPKELWTLYRGNQAPKILKQAADKLIPAMTYKFRMSGVRWWGPEVENESGSFFFRLLSFFFIFFRAPLFFFFFLRLFSV